MNVLGIPLSGLSIFIALLGICLNSMFTRPYTRHVTIDGGTADGPPPGVFEKKERRDIGDKSVFVVVVDEFNDEESARKAILNYLLKGIDIPHLITLNETSYIVAYRFFADPNKAKRALERIKKIKPDATIREVYPPEY